MQYQVRHLTTYQYQQSSSLSYNEAWIIPRALPYQTILKADLIIEPQPAILQRRSDFFGNQVAFLNVQQAHKEFSIEAISHLERSVPAYLEKTRSDVAWDVWKEDLKRFNQEYIPIKQFLLKSPLIPFSAVLKSYTQEIFLPGRSLFDAIAHLNTRIYEDYEYQQGFTTIATPLSEVVNARKGVCQDFAHVAIACLRSIGLPARYVSGYIETLPPEGEPLLVGSAASHAWFSSYIPGMGWVDFDPTNNLIVKDQHITLAWGRDYTDVPPLKGVIYNAGSHKLSVSVDVNRINNGEK